jgi:hypothetical protein
MSGIGEGYPATTLLRANAGMIRDCWIEEAEGYLCIRQVKFNNDGSEPAAKIIRLSPDEQMILFGMLALKGKRDA